MSFKISTFQELRNRFQTWPEMKAHFESQDGGSLRVVEQDGLAVVRYEKKGGAQDASTDFFRSVVWDTSGNLPLCVAPPRAQDGMPPLGVQLSSVEDFADGFMMNAWVVDGVLQVATRTRVGGENGFYSDKTFGTLFEECLATTPLKTMDALRDSLESIRAETKAVAAFASFVVQHPEHRVVAKFAAPGLYVVHTGYTTGDGLVHMSERAVNWPQALSRLQVPSYPTRTFATEANVEDLLKRTSTQRGWRWQGLVFKNGAGGRWRLRTPTYQLLRELRGSEATALDRFFRLRAFKKVTDYLKHYSEDRDLFWEYEQILRARTADVLAAYTDAHKAHAVAFKDLPTALKPAVYLLHLKWRDELRAKNFSVRLQNAIQVVNKLRGFEKKRLMDAEPYVAVSPARSKEWGGEAEEGEGEGEAEGEAQE
jgi:hypothetical protein